MALSQVIENGFFSMDKCSCRANRFASFTSLAAVLPIRYTTWSMLSFSCAIHKLKEKEYAMVRNKDEFFII